MITIIFAFDNKKIYVQAEVNNIQNQGTDEIINQNINEVANLFTVDKKTYKILEEGIVMLWSYNELIVPEDVIVENIVSYNGNVFEVKYIYEKAFNKITNIKSIKIESNIIGFCDSYGNLTKALDELFKDNKKLTNIDLGNIENSLGEKCFAYCDKMVHFNMSKNINSIGRQCFSKCYSLKEIDLSKIIKFNGQRGFEFCRELEDIGEFNDELKELPARTFMNCNNLKISSLKNIRKLDNECFEYCRFLDDDIVSDVEEIGENCFFGCNFSEIYLKKAKIIYDNAFGGISNLKKVRFGSSEIPFLSGNIVENSSVNEWVYPKDYETQPNYDLLFLNKLKVSNVKWFYNDGGGEYKTTQHVKLNSFIPPQIERENYEMEGWYKEPECINKVTIIADLGEVIGNDIVIKEPKLYAKWKCTVDSKLTETQKQEVENKPTPPSSNEEVEKEDNNKTESVEKIKDEELLPTDKPKEQESGNDNNNSKQSEEPIKKEEPSKNNDDNNKELDKEENKSTEPQTQIKEESNYKSEKKQRKTKKRVKLNEDNDFSRKIISEKNSENNIKDLDIKINDNKEIGVEQCNASTLDYKMAEVFISSILRDNNTKLEILNISYKDEINTNMEINKSWILGKIIGTNDSCLYLKNSDYFDNKSEIEIKFKENTDFSKLYMYNEELRKFMLVSDNLKVQDNMVRIKTNHKKEYLITNFELNKEEIVTEGWNKVNDDWYYIKEDYVLAINTIIDGHKLGNDGKLI